MQFVFDLHAAFRRIIKRFPGFLFRKPRKHIFQKGTGIRPAAGVNAQHADLVFSQKVDPVPGDLVRQQNELRFHKGIAVLRCAAATAQTTYGGTRADKRQCPGRGR